MDVLCVWSTKSVACQAQVLQVWVPRRCWCRAGRFPLRPRTPGPQGPLGRVPQRIPPIYPCHPSKAGRKASAAGMPSPGLPGNAPSGAPTLLQPGLQNDLLHGLLKNVLSSEDFAKYKDLLMPPTIDDKTLSREQEWAKKVKEQEQVQKQVDHHRKGCHDTELKLAKHQTEVSSLCMHVNAIELEIEALRSQVAVPPPAPSVLPSHASQGTPAFTPPGQIGLGRGTAQDEADRIEEDGEDMTDDDDGAGVGFLVPPKKWAVKGVGRSSSFSKPARSNRFWLRLQGLSKDELGRVSSECKALLGEMGVEGSGGQRNWL